jgi:hypothetical protein
VLPTDGKYIILFANHFNVAMCSTLSPVQKFILISVHIHSYSELNHRMFAPNESEKNYSTLHNTRRMKCIFQNKVIAKVVSIAIAI